MVSVLLLVAAACTPGTACPDNAMLETFIVLDQEQTSDELEFVATWEHLSERTNEAPLFDIEDQNGSLFERSDVTTRLLVLHDDGEWRWARGADDPLPESDPGSYQYRLQVFKVHDDRNLALLISIEVGYECTQHTGPGPDDLRGTIEITTPFATETTRPSRG